MESFSDKVVYQIHPKSFQDSNSDGIGDIPGIISRLDYLKSLGIDNIWLTPIFESPQNDGGYDIKNYYKIDPNYGTMEDLEKLIKEAQDRGIGIMLDMVFNHTSTEHEWFQKALAGDPYYQDFYILREGDANHPPTNWESKFGGSAWEYLPSMKKWYLHLFDKTQADLNWDNPNVRKELKKIIDFWEEKGISGFRFDVINLISKPDELKNDYHGDGRSFYTDGPHVHEYIKELVSDTNLDDYLTVGEMSSTSVDEVAKYSNPDEKELNMCFNFHHLKIDYKNGDKWELKEPDIAQLKHLYKNWQETMQEKNGWSALFWCNHDQPRAISRFGDDKKYWKESAKMIATCNHLMRGTPYIFQGEEIGMTNANFTSINQYRDVESLNYYRILQNKGLSEEEALNILANRSRDNGRTPMQWNDNDYAGFSDTRPWIELPDNYNYINVERELEDPDSILSYYRKLVKLRKDYPVIADGQIEFLYPEQEDLIAYKRYNDDQEILVLTNFSENTIPIELPEEFIDRDVLLSNYNREKFKTEQISLKPYEALALLRDI